MMSFICEWRAERPALRRHAKPWVPRASTIVPQGHWWGWQRFVPSRKPTATLTASSSNRRATTGDKKGMEPISRVWGHSCEQPGAVTWISTAEVERTVALSMSTENLSHEACFSEMGCWGQGWFYVSRWPQRTSGFNCRVRWCTTSVEYLGPGDRECWQRMPKRQKVQAQQLGELPKATIFDWKTCL